jgi:polyphenol oxidase
MLNKISAITSPNINTHHGFFTRHGGVSTGIYSSLNASYGSADERTNIDANRTKIAACFGCASEKLFTLKQTHSNICHVIDGSFATTDLEGDALATTTKGLILGVLTADCAPLLLHDANAGVIAAAHAGWKGALGGIIEFTIQTMQQLGANPTNINAAIGASIAQCSYEVELSFADAYLEVNPAWQKFFTPAQQATHLLFDNKAFCKEKLQQCGISNIEILPHDTYAEAQDYFSFRRATHLGEPDYGRQISAIML